MAGYTGTHDMISHLYATTKVFPSDASSECTELTKKMKYDLIIAKEEAQIRGVRSAFVWCAEMARCVSNVTLDAEPPLQHLRYRLGASADVYDRARGMFDRDQFFRAAYHFEEMKCPLGVFMHFYSRYLATERKMADDANDTVTLLPKRTPGPHLHEISSRLGPAYRRASGKDNYPAVSKGIVGIGNYDYKKSSMEDKARDKAAKEVEMRALHSKLGDADIQMEEGLPEVSAPDADVADEAEMQEKYETDANTAKLSETNLNDDEEASEEQERWGRDAYLMYLYGVALGRLGQVEQALAVLCWTLHLDPLCWAAWEELGSLVQTRDMLEKLDLPDVWMRRMFLVLVFPELNLDPSCLSLCADLEREGLKGCNFLGLQRAAAYRNRREYDQAIEEFKAIGRRDPFKLEQMDVFSHLLYVRERSAEIASLAARCTTVDRFTVETCCAVGNFYSHRKEREKAILNFQRALKLNPRFGSAWTLMGYEYMEMKLTQQATQAFRNAVEINKRDYRAWFGLAQSYEVLRQPLYALYYFKKAQRLHPYDSRIMTALGEAFERQELTAEAKKCYFRSYSNGDPEATALLKLAKLYERLGETARAANAYDRYLLDCPESAAHEDRGRANLFLAEYCAANHNWDFAEQYARKCIGCAETQEAAKSLLRDITHRRNTEADKAATKEDSAAPPASG